MSDNQLFVVKVEFAGKGVEMKLDVSQMRNPDQRAHAFNELVKALLFSHGIPVT
jgi:hypothetical protein